MTSTNPLSSFGFTPARGLVQSNDDRSWWAFVQLLASNLYIDPEKKMKF